MQMRTQKHTLSWETILVATNGGRGFTEIVVLGSDAHGPTPCFVEVLRTVTAASDHHSISTSKSELERYPFCDPLVHAMDT